MAILTQPTNPISANQDYTFELNVSELLQLVQSLTGSSYWEDVDNWRAVDFVYINNQRQYQRIVFNLANNETEVTFKFNEDCINGLFSCGRITVFGYVNNSFRIDQDEYGTQFDVIIEDGVVAGPNVDVTSLNVPLFDTYTEGDTLDFTVNFSDIVTVNGMSLLLEDGSQLLLENGDSVEIGETRLALMIGSTLKYATYLSGTSTSSVTYRYIVENDDQDLDGIEVLYIDLNGGSILDLNNQDVNITLPNVDTSGIIIDSVVPDTTAPTIVSITAQPVTYILADVLTFVVSFSENVTVFNSGVFVVDIGGVTVQAQYAGDDGFSTIYYSYTVPSGLLDTNGVQVVSFTGMDIRDLSGNQLDATLPAMNMTSVLVDSIVPTITSMSAPADDNYTTGEVISFVANFSQNVVVTGIPFLQVSIGSNVRQFNNVSGSGTNALTFSYTVLAGDLDEDGISFASTNIQVPSSTIRSAAGNNATLTFTTPSTTGITVNANIIEFSETLNSRGSSAFALTSKSLFILPYNTSDVNYYRINETGQIIFQNSIPVTGANFVGATETMLAIDSASGAGSTRVYNLDANGAPISYFSYVNIPHNTLVGIWDNVLVTASYPSNDTLNVYQINSGVVSTIPSQTINFSSGEFIKMTKDRLYIYNTALTVVPNFERVKIYKLNQITNLFYLDQTITTESAGLAQNELLTDVNNSSNILALGLRYQANSNRRGYALYMENNVNAANTIGLIPANFFSVSSDVNSLNFSNDRMFYIEYPNGIQNTNQQNVRYRSYTNTPSIETPTTLTTLTSGVAKIEAISETHLLIGNYPTITGFGVLYVYKI